MLGGMVSAGAQPEIGDGKPRARQGKGRGAAPQGGTTQTDWGGQARARTNPERPLGTQHPHEQQLHRQALGI